MKKRLVLIEGKNVSIVARDKDFGDAKNFVASRPTGSKILDLIGANGNSYDTATVEKLETRKSLLLSTMWMATI